MGAWPHPLDATADQPRHEGWARTVLRRLGFGVGVLVFTLVLVGQGIFLSRSLGGGTEPAAPPSGSLSHRLHVILARALGPSDRGVQRFRILRIASVHTNQKAVDITWAINDDLSGGTIGNGAEAEVYTMLRDLYSANLPIALVRLDGTYPLAAGKRDAIVMRLSMDRRTAALIDKVGWDTLDPQTLWPLVQRTYVNPALQPQEGS